MADRAGVVPGTVIAARGRDFRLAPTVLRAASDERLVEYMRDGSRHAFEVLFERYHRPVLGFCRHMLGSWEEAEDAAQQTFVAAYEHLLRDETPTSLRPWLYAVARHRCLSALRAARTRSDGRGPEPAVDSLPVEVESREDVRAVLADVARLPHHQRGALVLAELAGLRHEEIGAILGCSRERVKALVFQARLSLAAERTARDTPCAEIREQLATLPARAVRRAVVRRHLRSCPGCRAFRESLRRQRRALRLLLPVAPTGGFKRAVLGAVFGSGGGGAGTLSGGGLAATALVAVAIPAAVIVTAVTPVEGGRDAARLAVPAKSAPRDTAPTVRFPPPGGVVRLADRHIERRIASVGNTTGFDQQHAETRVRELGVGAVDSERGNDGGRASVEPAGGRDHPAHVDRSDQAGAAVPRTPPEPSAHHRADRPLRPVDTAGRPQPPTGNAQIAPATRPQQAARANPPSTVGSEVGGGSYPSSGEITAGTPSPAPVQTAPDRPAPPSSAYTAAAAAAGSFDPLARRSAQASAGGSSAANGNVSAGGTPTTHARPTPGRPPSRADSHTASEDSPRPSPGQAVPAGPLPSPPHHRTAPDRPAPSSGARPAPAAGPPSPSHAAAGPAGPSARRSGQGAAGRPSPTNGGVAAGGPPRPIAHASPAGPPGRPGIPAASEDPAPTRGEQASSGGPLPRADDRAASDGAPHAPPGQATSTGPQPSAESHATRDAVTSHATPATSEGAPHPTQARTIDDGPPPDQRAGGTAAGSPPLSSDDPAETTRPQHGEALADGSPPAHLPETPDAQPSATTRDTRERPNTPEAASKPEPNAETAPVSGPDRGSTPTADAKASHETATPPEFGTGDSVRRS